MFPLVDGFLSWWLWVVYPEEDREEGKETVCIFLKVVPVSGYDWLRKEAEERSQKGDGAPRYKPRGIQIKINY
jgi:hypothetical protein